MVQDCSFMNYALQYQEKVCTFFKKDKLKIFFELNTSKNLLLILFDKPFLDCAGNLVKGLQHEEIYF